jgi:hypothetical protein
MLREPLLLNLRTSSTTTTTTTPPYIVNSEDPRTHFMRQQPTIPESSLVSNGLRQSWLELKSHSQTSFETSSSPLRSVQDPSHHLDHFRNLPVSATPQRQLVQYLLSNKPYHLHPPDHSAISTTQTPFNPSSRWHPRRRLRDHQLTTLLPHQRLYETPCLASQTSSPTTPRPTCHLSVHQR